DGAKTEDDEGELALHDRGPIAGDQDRQERRHLRDQPVAESVAAPPHRPAGVQQNRRDGAHRERAGKAADSRGSRPEGGGGEGDGGRGSGEEEGGGEGGGGGGGRHENSGQTAAKVRGEGGAGHVLRERQWRPPIGRGVPKMEESRHERERGEAQEPAPVIP